MTVWQTQNPGSSNLGKICKTLRCVTLFRPVGFLRGQHFDPNFLKVWKIWFWSKLHLAGSCIILDYILSDTDAEKLHYIPFLKRHLDFGVSFFRFLKTQKRFSILCHGMKELHNAIVPDEMLVYNHFVWTFICERVTRCQCSTRNACI